MLLNFPQPPEIFAPSDRATFTNESIRGLVGRISIGTRNAYGGRITSTRWEKKPMTLDHPGVARWLQLIQAEYREMPGLSLKKAQMQRLWGLDSYVCDALVDALVAARVLRRTMDGSYMAYRTAH